MGHAHLIRQHVRQQLTACVQPLPYGLLQQKLADALGQRIHRHDPARQLVLARRLHQGIHHLPPQQVPLHLAAEHEAVPGVKALLAIGLVEERHVQHPGVVHRPHLHHRAPAGDAVAGGCGGDHGLAAGHLPHGKLPDGIDDAAVLIPPGEEADQLPQRGDPQLFQCLGPRLADTLDVPHIGAQIRHTAASFLWLFLSLYQFSPGNTMQNHHTLPVAPPGRIRYNRPI